MSPNSTTNVGFNVMIPPSLGEAPFIYTWVMGVGPVVVPVKVGVAPGIPASLTPVMVRGALLSSVGPVPTRAAVVSAIDCA